MAEDGLLTPEEIKAMKEKECETLVEGLSGRHRDVLQRSFNQIDTDENDLIDPKELRLFLSIKWKDVVPQETIESIVSLADLNEDGRISFEEFVRLQVKYMPLCRGYCRDCKKVIIGIDGWFCPACDPEHEKGMRKSFSLCLRCFSKNGKVEHAHAYKEFERFKMGNIGHDGVEDLSYMTKIRERVLAKKALESQLKDDDEHWGRVMKCITQ